MKYRSKPVEIEAIRYMGPFSIDEMYEAWDGFHDVGRLSDTGFFHIKTIEGLMLAKIGDWIIKGTIGEFYPCVDEVFRKKYEAIE